MLHFRTIEREESHRFSWTSWRPIRAGQTPDGVNAVDLRYQDWSLKSRGETAAYYLPREGRTCPKRRDRPLLRLRQQADRIRIGK